MRKNACGSDYQDRIAKGRSTIGAGDQPVSRCEGELHAVGEADYHDQRRHDIQEQVELKVQPPKRSQAKQDRKQRGRRGDNHERHASEESHRDQATCCEAECIVDDPIALQRVPDLELHDRDPGQACLQARAGQVIMSRLPYLVDDAGELRALYGIGVQRKDDQGQGAVLGQQLVTKNLVRLYSLDQLLIVRPLRQFVGNQRSRQLSSRWRLASGKQGDDATGAVDQLQVDNEVAQLRDRRALQQRLALNDDEDVEFAGRESPRLLLIQPELRRIRMEELAEGIVNLDPGDAKSTEHRQYEGQRSNRSWKAQRCESDPLDAERQIAHVTLPPPPERPAPPNSPFLWEHEEPQYADVQPSGADPPCPRPSRHSHLVVI